MIFQMEQNSNLQDEHSKRSVHLWSSSSVTSHLQFNARNNQPMHYLCLQQKDGRQPSWGQCPTTSHPTTAYCFANAAAKTSLIAEECKMGLNWRVSDEIGGVVLASGFARVVVVQQTLPSLDRPQREQNHRRDPLGQLADSSHVGLAGSLRIIDPVDEASHVGVPLRTDYQCFLRVATHTQVHQTVVLAARLQLDASSQRYYLTDVFAYQGFLLYFAVRYHVVAHTWAELEEEGTNWLTLVGAIYFSFSSGHVVKTEVEALLSAAVEGAVDGDEGFSVVHVLGQDGEQKSFLVRVYLLLRQFWTGKVEHFLGRKRAGFLLPLPKNTQRPTLHCLLTQPNLRRTYFYLPSTIFEQRGLSEMTLLRELIWIGGKVQSISILQHAHTAAALPQHFLWKVCEHRRQCAKAQRSFLSSPQLKHRSSISSFRQACRSNSLMRLCSQLRQSPVVAKDSLLSPLHAMWQKSSQREHCRSGSEPDQSSQALQILIFCLVSPAVKSLALFFILALATKACTSTTNCLELR